MTKFIKIYLLMIVSYLIGIQVIARNGELFAYWVGVFIYWFINLLNDVKEEENGK